MPTFVTAAVGIIQTLIVDGPLAVVWLPSRELLALQSSHPVPIREAEGTIPPRGRQIWQKQMTE